MNELQLHDELKTIIGEIIELDDFNDDDNFVTQLGVDSVMALEMVARIEKRYRTRIPEESFAQMKTLTDVVHIVSGVMQPANS
ncbi:acyl carrier protein [Ktedonobacteria bacterium brp13]|nr:acyl carrier protein [Ktedonobacteria bacterium brp13]